MKTFVIAWSLITIVIMALILMRDHTIDWETYTYTALPVSLIGAIVLAALPK